jgi:hypothetical protein
VRVTGGVVRFCGGVVSGKEGGCVHGRGRGLGRVEYSEEERLKKEAIVCLLLLLLLLCSFFFSGGAKPGMPFPPCPLASHNTHANITDCCSPRSPRGGCHHQHPTGRRHL